MELEIDGRRCKGVLCQILTQHWQDLELRSYLNTVRQMGQHILTGAMEKLYWSTVQDKVCNNQVGQRLFETRGSLNNKREAITNQVESSTSQGRSLEGILSKVKHVCTVKHTSFTMKIARECATSDSKVTRNGSVPSQKTQNALQRTHLMDFFQKNLGVTWGHIYQHHSCIKKSFKQKKNWPIL